LLSLNGELISTDVFADRRLIIAAESKLNLAGAAATVSVALHR
jgi:hypothetical protein